MSEGHPISMGCSRCGVRLYAATPRSGHGLLYAAARFVSVMYAPVWVLSRICRPQEEPLSAGRVRVHTCCECYNKRGYIRTWYVYQNFLFHFPFDEIYRRLLFFTLTRYGCATPGTYTNIFFLIFRLMTYTDVCFFSLLPETYVQHFRCTINTGSQLYRYLFIR